MANRKFIKRHTRQYQLRDENQADQHVASILDFWKDSRQELANFRKAITIFYALQQGDMQPLLNEFPQYKKLLDDGTEIKAMLELIISRQKNAPAPMLQPPPATGKLIGGFKPLAAPIDDDDDLLPALTVKKNVGDASANFLVSLTSVQ